MPIYTRTEGEEQPYWPLGPFKIRLPFVHFRLELPEFIQGMVMFVVGLGLIPLLQQTLGLTFEVALAFAVIFQVFMLVSILVGVPLFPGFITAGIPIVSIFLSDYEPGPEAIQALVALQILVFLLMTVLGVTGLGGKLVGALPRSIKAGILIGAGIAAILGEVSEGGSALETPASIIVGSLLSFIFLFSLSFRKLAEKNALARFISSYGLIPPMLIAIAVGWAVAEYPTPDVECCIAKPDFLGMWNSTPFVVGLPPVEVFLLAVPTAVIAYIIAFGDMVVGNELTKTADQARQDEKIDISINRLHLVTGLRNLVLAFIAPHPGLAGPIWTAGHASVLERYKQGRKAMDSIYGGVGTMMIAFMIGIFLLPLISVFQPVLPIALALTLILTGYVSITIGMAQIDTPAQRGVAGVTAVVLALHGAIPGIITGVVLYFAIERTHLLRRRGEHADATADPSTDGTPASRDGAPAPQADDGRADPDEGDAVPADPNRG